MPQHRGVSLVEVLMAIFVVAIGLLGLAALFPVASRYAQQGALEDRAAAVGRRAGKEILVYGGLEAENFAKWDLNLSTKNDSSSGALCLDPLVMGALANAADSAGTNTINEPFPYVAAAPDGQSFAFTALGMRRISLFSRPRDKSSKMMRLDQATELCVSHDDLLFTLDKTDIAASPQPVSAGGASTFMKREFEGHFSWFATIVPEMAATGQINKLSADQYVVSVAVVHRRNVTNYKTSPALNEVVARVRYTGGSTSVDSSGLEVKLHAETEDKLAGVKPGNWVLMVAASPKRYRWYRVANVESKIQSDGTPASEMWYRRASLQGADWKRSGSDYCIIVKGVVAVYEKTMALESNNLSRAQ